MLSTTETAFQGRTWSNHPDVIDWASLELEACEDNINCSFYAGFCSSSYDEGDVQLVGYEFSAVLEEGGVAWQLPKFMMEFVFHHEARAVSPSHCFFSHAGKEAAVKDMEFA